MATVDSGADRSFFPKKIAELLGLGSGDLVEDQGGAKGVEGIGFPTWSTTKPLTCRIVRIVPGTGREEAWGPAIAMNPAFAEKDVFLLGRDDFFRPLSITFAWDGQGPHFVMSY